ncbi:MAG: ketoacyl-ACP synthase III [Phycisphaeraceae bacterium]|nr:MAG: ketoacyl-ACP synthase III [Phycisphaeraceae bacterium]
MSSHDAIPAPGGEHASAGGGHYPAHTPKAPRVAGVEFIGTGSYLPEDKITNAGLERIMDTTDEWIVQRTGIRERRKADPAKHESAWTMASGALENALADARIPADQLDLIIVATVSSEMATPSVASRIANRLKAGKAAAFDLAAACSGWVYGLNVAHEMIRGGGITTAAVIGTEHLTQYMDYSTAGRGCAILFGDGAGAAVLRRAADPAKGAIAWSMHGDGTGWKDLYIPRRPDDLPEGTDPAAVKMGQMFMNGREVFKFAVGTFQSLIAETLDKAGVRAESVAHFVCHQSNVRILEAARERFGIPQDKLYVNIHRVGNTSAASVPICFDELRRAGRIHPGDKVMFLAFGAGLTWSSSLWQF